MGRWEPDAGDRFRAAAMALFNERGYAETTVADIAERAGLTRRTFFRHFADKREVLFEGSQRLQHLMVDALAAAPTEASAMEAVRAGLLATADFFGDDPGYARQRNALIAAHAELHERELIKLATLSAALAEALRARGVPAADALLAGEAGIAVFRTAFALWLVETPPRGFGPVLQDSLARLGTLLKPP